MGHPWVRRQLPKSHPQVSARVRATKFREVSLSLPSFIYLFFSGRSPVATRFSRICGPEASRAICTNFPAPHSLWFVPFKSGAGLCARACVAGCVWKNQCWLYYTPRQGRTPSRGPWAPGRAWGGAGLCYPARLVSVLRSRLPAYIWCWSLCFCMGHLVCLPSGSRPLLWLCGAVSWPLSGGARDLGCSPKCAPVLSCASLLPCSYSCHSPPFLAVCQSPGQEQNNAT